MFMVRPYFFHCSLTVHCNTYKAVPSAGPGPFRGFPVLTVVETTAGTVSESPSCAVLLLKDVLRRQPAALQSAVFSPSSGVTAECLMKAADLTRKAVLPYVARWPVEGASLLCDMD